MSMFFLLFATFVVTVQSTKTVQKHVRNKKMLAGDYELVHDGICPNGYAPVSSENECKTLAGKTISNRVLKTFTVGCNSKWTPPHTCFVWTNNNQVYYVNKECGQNPRYDNHRLVCKKED